MSPTVDNLKKDAKRWLKALRAGDPDARARFERAWPDGPASPVLRDVQHALAREHGYENWLALTRPSPVDDYLLAINERDEGALQRLNAHYERAFTVDDLLADVWRRSYSYRQRVAHTEDKQLKRDEAESLVAQDAGYGVAFTVDADARCVTPARHLRASDWDQLIGTIRERRVSRVDAAGRMTDAALAALADSGASVVDLDLSGSRALTAAGLKALARMPQLERLNLSSVNVTDAALAVLSHLPALRDFEMTWTRGVTDAGLANLESCDQLERVDVMGTMTGDGVLAAVQRLPHLHTLYTGRLVTDAGLERLPTYRALATVLIDGPFTNDGLLHVARMPHLRDLELFWHATTITASGLRHLVDVATLERIGADGQISDDAAMAIYGRMPALRRLKIQETTATDDGFVALARSATLENLWTGRDEIAMTDRGFAALCTIATLQNLGVSGKHVTDAGLAHLADLPALRELTPIDFTDEGFRHIARCKALERLSCMYCRDTGDRSTAFIEPLTLRSYYAGLTKITDRSLEIMGRMSSFEEIEFYETLGITDAGMAFLTPLPRLKRVVVSHVPRVTYAGTRIFPTSVRVDYTS